MLINIYYFRCGFGCVCGNCLMIPCSFLPIRPSVPGCRCLKTGRLLFIVTIFWRYVQRWAISRKIQLHLLAVFTRHSFAGAFHKARILFSITRLKPPASSRSASADKMTHFEMCHGLQVWQPYGFSN